MDVPGARASAGRPSPTSEESRDPLSAGQAVSDEAELRQLARERGQ